MKKKNMILLTASLLFLVGCGGVDLNQTQPITSSSATISDSQISGLQYICGSHSGFTDDNGTFKYFSDCSTTTFKIGNIELGSIQNKDIKDKNGTVYPADLLGLDRNDTNNTQLVSMITLLQSLDSDQNPYNGIQIDSTTTAVLKNLNSDSNISDIITTAGKNPIKAEYAISHYEETLRKDLNLSIDTVPPAPAVFSKQEYLTNKDNIIVEINGKAGSKIFVDGVDINKTIDQNNSALLDLNTSGADGEKTFIIVLKDTQNRDSDDFQGKVLKDTVPPQKAVSFDIPSYINESTKDKDKVSITVNGEANSTVFVNGVKSGFIETNSTKVDLNTTGEDGTKTFEITLEDKAGNFSAPYIFSIIKDTQPPEKATTNAPRFINSDSKTIEVTGEIGSTVYLGDTLVGTIPNTGKLSVTLDTAGEEGTKSFNLKIYDKAGNPSETEVISIIKDITPPFKPTMTTKASLVDGKLEVIVYGEKNTKVYVGDEEKATIAKDGKVDVFIENPNQNYYETFNIKLVDEAGNSSQISQLITTFSRVAMDDHTVYFVPENNTVLQSSTDAIIMSYENNQSLSSAVAKIDIAPTLAVNDKLNSIINSVSSISDISNITKLTEDTPNTSELVSEYTIQTTQDIALVDLIGEIINNILGGTLSSLPVSVDNAVKSNYFNIVFHIMKSTEKSFITISLVPNDLSLKYQTTISSVSNIQNIEDSNATQLMQQDDLNATSKYADFLFVIDDSGSMDGYQNAISAAANTFSDAITKADIAFRIGIITTSGNINYTDPTDDNYTASRVINDVGLIENNISLFKEKVMVGIHGDTTETGIYNAEQSLKSKLWGDSFDGVVTAKGMPADKNTSLSVIILSDEESQYQSRAGYGNYFDVNNNLFTQRGYTVYSIINPAKDSISQYDDLAIKTNGLIADISNTSNYNTIMNSIAQKAAATVGYKLTKSNITESTIYVTVNGNYIPHSNTNGWKYSDAYNSIIFYGDSVPKTGDTVRITYSYTK